MRKLHGLLAALLLVSALPALAADKKPLVTDAGKTRQMTTGETVPLANGGTGATDAAGIRTAIGVDTDATLSANSDSKIASQKATKTYVDAQIVASGSGTVTSVSGNRGLTGTVTTSGNIGIDVSGATSGKVLTGNGTSSDPTFQTPSIVKFSCVTTAASQTSIDFSSIPSGGKALRLVGNLRGSSTGTIVIVRFNGDTNNSNYQAMQLQVSGGSVSGNVFAAGSSAAAAMAFDQANSASTSGIVAAATADIPAYAGTTFKKSWVAHSGYATVYKSVEGQWLSTSAINQVTLSESGGQAFANGLEMCLFVLY